ncbi:MAG: hypothetical protein ACRD5Z_09320, partial [Bryobacteraceae bacterium]
FFSGHYGTGEWYTHHFFKTKFPVINPVFAAERDNAPNALLPKPDPPLLVAREAGAGEFVGPNYSIVS